MSHLFSFSTGLSGSSVDTEAGVIRGVSVLTSDLVARGHDLEVDSVTLEQLIAAAEAKGGQIPVKVDHKSGAAAVCGYLNNFHLDGKKAKADWHLLATHPQRDQILEVAERMPTGVGLSASFIAPKTAEKGKARVEELISVDYVTLPAANPDGLFSARAQRDPAALRRERLAKVGRVVGAGALGAIGGAGLVARGVDSISAVGVRRLQPSAKVRAGLIGAGAALGAAHTVRAVTQKRPMPRYADELRREREMAAHVRTTLFAVLKESETKEAARRVAVIHPHRPLGKTQKLLSMKNTSALEKRIAGLIDKHAAHQSVGRHAAKRESGTLKTLAARLSLPDSDHVLPLIESGRLKSFGSVHRNDPDGTQSYRSADLNEIRREVFSSIAEQVIEDYEGELENLPLAISATLESYASSLKDGTAAKGFSALPRRSVSFAARQDEERPGLIKRAATGAAVAGGLYAGASYLRGRKIGAKGILPAFKAGNAANVADLRKIGGKASALLRPRVKFSANLTPARARDLLTRLGNEIRRIERA